MVQARLAELLRPQKISEISGQNHVVGKDGIVTRLLLNNTGLFPSLIFWGPPGCGKTTLARCIAAELDNPFLEFSAVNASVKEIVEKIKKPKFKSQTGLFESKNRNLGEKVPVVFIDEIHRFNKSQQDALLPHVETGNIILIGATTENPSFEVISPLLSRCRVIVLEQLNPTDLADIVNKGLLKLDLNIEPDAKDFIVTASNGDARVALNVLEIADKIKTNKTLDIDTIEQALQRKQLSFDLKGEEYYNTISAFHKSIRGSDPDAALYYLARMLEAGQDPLYIARRLIRAASEDIGLADPQALVIAVAAFEACDKIGVPECNLALAEAVTYLAKSPKSNALYIAYGEVAEDVTKYGNLPVPLHIRNAPTKLMKDLGYSKDYNYHHSPSGQKIEAIDYLPEKLKDRKYISKRIKDQKL